MALGGIGSDVWHHPYMTNIYQWTTHDDEIALDAIIVGIGGTSAEMVSFGLTYVEPQASIYWSAWFGPDGQVTDADFHPGPFDVPAALKKAEELRVRFGFPRVVIALEERGMWRDQWGELAEEEGLS